MREFDVFIIGTGTAGVTAASDLVAAGLRVGIADEIPFGGTCALRGCQPKKFLVVPAHAALEGIGLVARGFTSAPQLDWSVMQASREEFTSAVPEGTEKWLAELGITAFHDHCAFEDPHTLRCGTEEIRAKNVIVASGARPRPLEIPGSEFAKTSDDFLSLEELPSRIAFIGGGYISLEFATVASAVGSSATVIQRADRIMERFDPAIVSELREGCASRNIDIRTGVKPVSISQTGDGYSVSLDNGTTVEADIVIAAVGRVPNVDRLNLEAAGVETGPKGITVDSKMRTTAPGVFAIGDCADTFQLAPVGDYEAHIAAKNIIASGEGPEIDYGLVPTVVFTYPQMAQVGQTEPDSDPDLEIVSGTGGAWPNYRRLNDPHMCYRVLKRKSDDTIVGATILAPQAGEIINAFTTLIEGKVTAARIKELPWAYPTYLADIKYMVG